MAILQVLFSLFNYHQAIRKMKLQVVQKDNKYYGELPTKSSSLTVNSTYIRDVDVNVIIRYGKVCRVDFRGAGVIDANTYIHISFTYICK